MILHYDRLEMFISIAGLYETAAYQTRSMKKALWGKLSDFSFTWKRIPTTLCYIKSFNQPLSKLLESFVQV